MDQTYAQVHQDVLQTLEKGDAREALRKMRSALSHTASFTDAELKDAFDVMARILTALEERELSAAFKKAAKKPGDASVLFQLGFELVDRELFSMGAMVLTRLNQLKPGNEEYLCELVFALEGLGANHQARQVLLAPEASRLRDGFVCSYLLAFNALMCCDLEEPRQRLPRLLKERDPEYAEMAESLAQMMHRVDAIKEASKLDAEDLRGWHYVVNGGVLLHLAPVGMEVMRGRYAFTQDSDARCLEGIKRLGSVLDTMQLKPPAVFAPQDRPSRILARATSQLLGLPMKDLPDVGTLEPGLLVAYDLSLLDDKQLDGLMWHRPGQLLWVQAAEWTDEPAFCADFTTYLYQTNRTPWEEHMVVDATTRAASTRPERSEPEEQLANAIINASLSADALHDLEQVKRLCQAISTLRDDSGAGAFQRKGHRRRQRTDSPVKSARFA